jgi:hypothetical protein
MAETQMKKGKKNGIAIGIDFSSLHEPECRNPTSPDTEHSDYETWIPSDGKTGHGCLLGVKTIYVRRKRDATCFNSQKYEANKIIEICHCTDEDYECDYGFHRTDINEPCTPMGGMNETERNKPPENCHGYYTVSRGYRKVPGNKCVGGVTYEPIVIPCSNTFFSFFSIAVFLILVAILAFLVYNFSSSFNTLPSNISGFVKSITEKKTEEKRSEDKGKYKNVEHTINFPEEDDNVLFDDKEDQPVEQFKHSDQKEMEDIKNELLPENLGPIKSSAKVPPINKKNSQI